MGFVHMLKKEKLIKVFVTHYRHFFREGKRELSSKAWQSYKQLKKVFTCTSKTRKRKDIRHQTSQGRANKNARTSI
jgi:hypothetical protein